jgi:hypothetical protein
MSTVTETYAPVTRAEVTDELITFYLADGRIVSVPLFWSWRLEGATPSQRKNYEIIGNGHGIHWPDIDEDLSVRGMFHGIPAKRPKK